MTAPSAALVSKHVCMVRIALAAAGILLGFGLTAGTASADTGLLGKTTSGVTKTVAGVTKSVAPKSSGKTPVAKKASSAARTVKAPVRSVAKPIARKTVRPVIRRAVQPVVRHAAKPVVRKVTKPVVRKVAKPVVRKVAKPVVRKVANPVVRKVDKAVVRKVDKAVVRKVDKAVNSPVATGSLLTPVHEITGWLPAGSLTAPVLTTAGNVTDRVAVLVTHTVSVTLPDSIGGIVSPVSPLLPVPLLPIPSAPADPSAGPLPVAPAPSVLPLTVLPEPGTGSSVALVRDDSAARPSTVASGLIAHTTIATTISAAQVLSGTFADLTDTNLTRSTAATLGGPLAVAVGLAAAASGSAGAVGSGASLLGLIETGLWAAAGGGARRFAWTRGLAAWGSPRQPGFAPD